MSSYKVGIAQCDITPPVGIYLAGYAGRTEPSTAIYHPLRAVATAIDDGKTPLLILMAEWLGFYDQTERVRAQLVQATGLDEKQIVLSGTHTHCGPSVRQMDALRTGALDEDYITEAIDRMTAAARQAWTKRIPAVLRFGNGHCTVARCRRKPDPDHPPKIFREMLPYNDGKVDHNVPLLTIESPEGKLRGVLFSYACHPTSRGGLLAGGDYPAFAMDRIEQQHPGAIACFLQGCAGDQKPRPVDLQSPAFGQREIDQVRDIGEELGDAVNQVIAAGKLDAINGDIAVTQQMLELHTEPLDKSLAKQCLSDESPYKQQWARHQLDAIDRGQPVSTAIAYELQTVAFGKSLVIVTLAAEMCVEYSLRLKRELAGAFRHVLPLAYTNHIVGYIPVRRQIPEGGYEVWDANQYHQRTGPYIASTEQQIIDAARAGVDVGQ